MENTTYTSTQQIDGALTCMLTQAELALGMGAVLIATVHAVDHAVLDGPGVVIHTARVRGINT